MMIAGAQSHTQVTRQPFGTASDGTPVEIYTLENSSIEARIMTYGGIVVSLKTPDRQGKPADIVLGYDSLDKYIANSPYFGAIIGRYANRIAHGRFILDGIPYQVPVNNGENSLHGGIKGFDKVVWKARQIRNGIELKYVSKDREEGYPGTLRATVRYTLSGNDLRIEYTATTDKLTVVNLTNHSYFNLAGQGQGDVLQHLMKINASRYTPVDAALIPLGELEPVASTPFDFRKPTAIGKNINSDNEQVRRGKGWDHNWVLDGSAGKIAEAAEAYEPTTGRVLDVLTDQPGVQFYSGNFLDGSITGKESRSYPLHAAFCLETQHFPDSPNHPRFPSTELRPGQRYHTVTVYRFSAR